jgi:hypothetical protein
LRPKMPHECDRQGDRSGADDRSAQAHRAATLGACAQWAVNVTVLLVSRSNCDLTLRRSRCSGKALRYLPASESGVEQSIGAVAESAAAVRIRI